MQKINSSIMLKYQFYGIATNPFVKMFFYFMSLMNSVFLKGMDLTIFTLLIFLLTIIALEFIFEIIINPPLNEKQRHNLTKFYLLCSIPSAIPFATGDYTFLAIPFTFVILSILLEVMKNSFSNSRRILLISLISFFIVFFLSSFNTTYFLIELLLLTLFTLLPLRIVQHLQFLYLELDVNSQNIIENYKETKERISRYARNFKMEITTPIIFNNHIYFVVNDTVYDDQENKIKDIKIIDNVKNLYQNKKTLIQIFKKHKLKPNLFGIILSSIISLFFSYELLKVANRFMLRNYDHLDFVGKGELDKKLTKSDTELSIIHDDLSEHLFKLFAVSKEFISVPSDNLLKLIQDLHQLAHKDIIERGVERKIEERVKTAEKLYENKKYLMWSFEKMKQSIDKQIAIISDFGSLK